MRSVRPARRRPLHALARAASWHRRKLAVVAAIAAVLTGISAAAPAGPAMITAVKARTQLAGGTVVSASDISVERVAATDVPEGVVTDPDDLVGKTLAAPVAKNQMMTLLATTTARGVASPGQVIAPLRLADSAQAALLQPGDVVDIVAADSAAEQAAVIAASARVVTVPEVPDDRAGPAPEGALVLVDVDAQTATALAQAAATGALSIMWR
jgi:SAF domain-containing protein